MDEHWLIGSKQATESTTHPTIWRHYANRRFSKASSERHDRDHRALSAHRHCRSGSLEQWHGVLRKVHQSGVVMQLELGQLIIDTQEDLNDIGVVVEVGWQHSINDGVSYPYCKIYWVCRRTHGLGDYTSTLAYSQEELDLEEFECFEIIEKRTQNVLDFSAQQDTL